MVDGEIPDADSPPEVSPELSVVAWLELLLEPDEPPHAARNRALAAINSNSEGMATSLLRCIAILSRIDRWIEVRQFSSRTSV
jgi:hypothetical protein